MEAALVLGYEATLEEALMTDARVSIKITTGKIQHLSLSAEPMRSPFREEFQRSQCVETDGLLALSALHP